jgi:cytochrome c oxidase subunit IV
MKTIKYHIIFIFSLLSGGITVYCFALGIYELAQAWAWNVLFVPLAVLGFVASVLYITKHRVEPKSEKAKREKGRERIKKELQAM